MTETLFIEPVNMCNTFHTTKAKHWLKQIFLQSVSLLPSSESFYSKIVRKCKITKSQTFETKHYATTVASFTTQNLTMETI